MWKVIENEEYATSSPAVQAHFHAVRAEEALKKEDFVQAEREGRLASEKFLEAANSISDKRTIDALMLLAENYEYRSKEARARNPQPEQKMDESPSEPAVDEAHKENEDDQDTDHDAIEPDVMQKTSSLSSDDKVLNKQTVSNYKSGAVEAQLNMAADEMEELWRRLHEIGLSSAGSSDKNNVLMSSRHLSSSLGDSFFFVPSKARTSIGVHATAVDGGSTLRAAVASRMRNQRVRLMEKQLGPRSPVDDRLHKQRGISNTSHSSSSFNARMTAAPNGTDLHSRERTLSANNGSVDTHDIQNLQETIAHQKYEIVRLLNTVKTLSNENTKLVTKCDALTNVQTENREIQESMDRFKTHYNQKLIMIKRALEEWRRQRDQLERGNLSAAASNTISADTAVLKEKLKMQEKEIAQLTEAMKSKDEMLAKYEKWYKTLKAGAKAKQRSQNMGGSNPGSSYTSGSNGVTDGFGGGSGISRGSFTSSDSFHDYSMSDSSSQSSSRQISRPPAHPNRRAL